MFVADAVLPIHISPVLAQNMRNASPIPPPCCQGCTNNNDNSCGWTRPFTSARVRTKASPSGSWRYGRFEVRAQLPRGDFLWPAIWMLPTDK